MADSFVHFEMPADDPDALMKFYGDVFGWTFQRFPAPHMPGGEYIGVTTKESGAPGLDGGMYKRFRADDRPRNYILVASVDDALARVTAASGTVIMGVTPIHGVGNIAIIADPEGNGHGLVEGGGPTTG